MLRLTWVQPEDLLGHELRQAAQDGREAAAIAARWRAAGGPECPLRAGASAAPASPYLRVLARDLLDELADLPSGLAEQEPTDLARIKDRCPDWRPSPAAGGRPTETAAGSRATEAAGGRGAAETVGGHRATETVEGRRATEAATDRQAAEAATDRQAAETTAVGAAPAPDRAPAQTRLEASWLGRAVGCLLGKPVEKLPLQGIRELARATGNWPLHAWFTARGLPPELAAAFPWNTRSAPTSLAENIDGMPEDDDLNYPLLNLLLLQRHGRGFSTADVARLWLDELPAGRTFTAERIAYRNLLTGVEPPHTARHRNPFREWIGALIRADVHGWTNPGDPGAAAEQAHRDATLTHTANGVYAAMFAAATIAEAAGGAGDVHHCLRTGLSVVPPASRLAEAVADAVELAGTTRDFDAVVDQLHATHRVYHWVHAVPNTALIAAALTHADGDFTGSVCRAVSGGWDTDSNGATAGSIAGLLAGDPGAIPERWTAPLKNRLATSIADFNGIGFDTLAQLTHRLSRPETPQESAHS